ncbi:MAG: LCP family protein, partial [Candidatus Eremiobacterota bacterium]
RNLYVLVVGLDNNWTEQDIVYTKGARTDTIMLVNFNLDNKTAGVLSIPRDSRVYIPGYYEEKINSAYSLGGIELAMKTVSEVFKIPVDYYIVVRTQALPKLVDALGGIETYVEKDMDYDDNWGHLHIHLKEGWQTIDGDRAVQYSRFRKDDEGDLGRIRRQQQVIYAVKSKASRIAGINELRNLIQTVLENVDTNFSTTELMALANIYKHMNMKDVKMGTIPTYGDDSSGVSYQIIDETQLQAYIDEYLMGKIPEPSVEILNGSTEVGIAKKLEERLVSIGGFNITEVKNADRDDYETSQIIINSTKLDTQSVADIVALIGKPDILSNPSEPSGTSDITIILGKDYAKICSSGPDQ